MSMFTAKIIGDVRKEVAARIDGATRDATNAAAQAILRGIQIESADRTLKRRTGKLSSSWFFVPARKVAGGWGAAVKSTVVYAAIHEFGGVIRPKRARFLTFKLRDGGWVRTRKVTMPARRYVTKAIKRTQARATAQAAAAMQRRLL